VRELSLIATLVAVLVVGLGAVRSDPSRNDLRPGQAGVEELRIVSPFELVEEYDPKFAGSRPVHVLESSLLELTVRTEQVERVDILVALSGTESFGVFSGTPDGDGTVEIEVVVPEAGSMHDWRVPGPQGLRRPGPVRPGTVFMLVPYGIVEVAPFGWIRLSRAASWSG